MQLFKFTDTLLSQFDQSPDRVFVSRNSYKIFDSIIILDTIKMMNQIAFGQLAIMSSFPYQQMFSYVLRLTIYSPNIYQLVACPISYRTTFPIRVVFTYGMWLTMITIRSSRTMQLLPTRCAVRPLILKHFFISTITRYSPTTKTVLTITMSVKFLTTMLTVFNMFHSYIIPQSTSRNKFEKKPELRE